MQGEAFKCDQCGRLMFIKGGADGPPPTGWFALSQVPEYADDVWPMWHFDTVDCVAEFVAAKNDMPSQALDGVAADLDDDLDDGEDLSQSVAEQVLSAWTAAMNDPERSALDIEGREG